MPKIEIPGLNPKGHVHTESPEAPEVGTPAEEAKPPAQEPAASESPQGVPLEGDLDPVLSQAVDSQPKIPVSGPPLSVAEPGSSAAKEEAAASTSFYPARRRAPAGLLAAGALAVAGMLVTAALGGKRNGRSTGTQATGTTRSHRTPAFTDVFDGDEARFAQLFGISPD